MVVNDVGFLSPTAAHLLHRPGSRRSFECSLPLPCILKINGGHATQEMEVCSRHNVYGIKSEDTNSRGLLSLFKVTQVNQQANPYTPPTRPGDSSDLSPGKTSGGVDAVLLSAIGLVWAAYFLQGMPIIGTIIFASIAVALGLAGHLLYRKWLSSRLTVVGVVLLFFNGIILVASFKSPWGVFRTFAEINLMPLELTTYVVSGRDLFFATTCFGLTILMTPAHMIQPRWQTAILSALGISMWYGTTLLLMMHAG